jgi:GDP-L-fucose synthase
MLGGEKMFFSRSYGVLVFCFLLLCMSRGEASMDFNAKIWVAGHNGLAGSAIVRQLKASGYNNLVLIGHTELDLCDQAAVDDFYAREQPEYVFVAAAKVGGILANSEYPAEFISDNLAIERNVIHGAHLIGVKGLLFLGSACIYPRDCPQPIKEEYLLTGPLENTNEWYSVAKIGGLKLCQAYSKQYGRRFISLMPTNLYGPGDNFDLHHSHVLPALVRKFVEAKENNEPQVVVWGSGTPLRDFLFVDDLAEAAIWVMNHYEGSEWLNVGTGEDLSIIDTATLIADIIGYRGQIVSDASKPDGTPRRVLDVSRINALGWKARVGLREGLERTILWYQNHRSEARLTTASGGGL